MDQLNPSPEGDASATRRGLVNLIAQVFAGAKTFNARITGQAGLVVHGVVGGSLSISADQDIAAGGAVFAGTDISATGDLYGTNAILSAGLSVGGVARFSAGTLVSTSIGPTGDDNTGINFPAADTINMVTGGTLRYQISSTGTHYFGASTAQISSAGVVTANGGFISGTTVSLTRTNGPLFIYASGVSAITETIRIASNRADSGLKCTVVGTEQASPNAAAVLFQVAKGITTAADDTGNGTSLVRVLGSGRAEFSNGVTVTGQAIGVPGALTSSAASIAVDLAAATNFAHTLTENTTLAAPSNPVAGQSGSIVFTQHASAPKTLGFNAYWKFPGGSVPSLTATNGAVDVLAYYIADAGGGSTYAVCSLLKDVK